MYCHPSLPQDLRDLVEYTLTCCVRQEPKSDAHLVNLLLKNQEEANKKKAPAQPNRSILDSVANKLDAFLDMFSEDETDDETPHKEEVGNPVIVPQLLVDVTEPFSCAVCRSNAFEDPEDIPLLLCHINQQHLNRASEDDA